MLVVPFYSPLLQHSQISSGWALQIILQSLWYEIRIRAPTKWPKCLWRLVVISGFSFPTRGTEVLGKTSLCGDSLSCGRDNVANICHFPHQVRMQSHLVYKVQGCSSASLPCSRILSVVSCSWIDVSCSCESEWKSGMTYVANMVRQTCFILHPILIYLPVLSTPSTFSSQEISFYHLCLCFPLFSSLYLSLPYTWEHASIPSHLRLSPQCLSFLATVHPSQILQRSSV